MDTFQRSILGREASAKATRKETATCSKKSEMWAGEKRGEVWKNQKMSSCHTFWITAKPSTCTLHATESY